MSEMAQCLSPMDSETGSRSKLQSGPKVGLHCVAWNNATNQGKSRVNKSHSCGE